MEKRNQKLTIIVGALLLVIGVSFSYFLATTLIKGNGASTVGTTARINGATLNVEGTLEFDDTGILPGHKNVSAIKLTASGNNELIAYNLIWQGTNGISQINYTVYKSSTPKTLSTNCSNKTSVVNGMQVLSEECSVNNIDTLGESIANGSINKGDTKVILAKDEFITATSSGTSWYYYVVLEYPNLDIDQSSDVEATFEGEVTVEESDKKADINILAVYVADDSGNYTETTDIPQSGYQLNTEKSTCSNGAYPTGIVPNITVNNLSKSGTSCYLYFDKIPTSEDTLAKLGIANPKEPTENMFASTATTDEGVFKAEDLAYGGTSYYYRGAVTNNYVKFGGFCWRIIRINGDGSIRMIYDGASCHANGTSTTESLLTINGSTGLAYNTAYNDNAYVGYMSGINNTGNSTSYAEAHTNNYDSTIKRELDSWYDNNLKLYESYISETAGFCNDRKVSSVLRSGYGTLGYGTNITAYAPIDRVYDSSWNRLGTQKPSLGCKNMTNDLFTPNNSNADNKGNKKLSKPIGLITMDEVIFAGGYLSNANSSYYLYNGNYYWTMSPYYCTGDNASVFRVGNEGGIHAFSVSWTEPGVRPVINLRSDITFSSGDGTLNAPYEVL